MEEDVKESKEEKKEESEAERKDSSLLISANANTPSSSKLDALKREDLLAIVKKQYISLNAARKQIDVYKNELHEKDQRIEKLTSSHKQESNESNSDTVLSTSDMISMELMDYKRSLESTRKSLNECKNELKNKESIMKELDEKYQSTAEEKEVALESLRTSVEEQKELKRMLEEKSMEISENSKEINSLVAQISATKGGMESEIKRLNDEMADKNRQLTESRQAEIKSLAELRHTKSEFEIFQRKHDDLHQEFDQFKERAQYVLKQYRTDDSSTSASKNDENKSTEIKELIETLHARNEEISIAKSKCSVLEDEMQILRQHIDALELQLQNASDSHFTALALEKTDHQKAVDELRQRIENDRIAMEKLRQDHSSLLAQRDVDAQKAAEEFEQRIDELSKLNSSLQKELSELKATLADSMHNKTGENVPTKSHQLFLSHGAKPNIHPSLFSLTNKPVTMSVKNTQKHIQDTNYMPFNNSFNEDEAVANSESEEEDLSQSLQSVLNERTESVGPDSARPLEADFWKWENDEEFTLQQQKNSLEERVVDVEHQLAHTRDILAETEETNVKLAQQVQLLKEEIRRAERDAERSAHLAKNSEYLKNVILKFLAPQKVNDERHQMLPVLKTMLKLTSEECADIERNIAETSPFCNPADESKANGNAKNDWTTYIGSLRGMF